MPKNEVFITQQMGGSSITPRIIGGVREPEATQSQAIPMKIDPHGLVGVANSCEMNMNDGTRFITTSVIKLAASESINMLYAIPAPEKSTYITADVYVSVGCDVYVYEDPTVTVSGSLLDNINLNRNSSITSSMQMYGGPTVTDSGSLLSHTFMGAGTKNSPIPASDDVSFIFNPTKTYLMKVVPIADNAYLSLGSAWCETDIDN